MHPEQSICRVLSAGLSSTTSVPPGLVLRPYLLYTKDLQPQSFGSINKIRAAYGEACRVEGPRGYAKACARKDGGEGSLILLKLTKVASGPMLPRCRSWIL